MTAEDPVEYNLMGINQVLVRTEIGLTFAAALKAFLRQDPNIIMVGEIRDLETGGIAIKAALTGHLVLSTLHTNDAPEHDHPSDRHGASRPFNVASAVNLVVAQRLVRRICKDCKGPHKYTDEELPSLGTDLEKLRAIPFMKGTGCDTCSGTGYKGRAGLYEVMALSPELRRMILRGASVAEHAGSGGGRGDAHPAHGRHEEDRARRHHPRRSRQGDSRMSFNLRALLEEMIEKEASDLHITAGERPKLRVDGDITDSSVDRRPDAQGHAAARLLGPHREPEEAVRDRGRARLLLRHPEPGALPRQLLQAARLRVDGHPQIPFNVRDLRGARACRRSSPSWPSGRAG